MSSVPPAPDRFTPKVDPRFCEHDWQAFTAPGDWHKVSTRSADAIRAALPSGSIYWDPTPTEAFRCDLCGLRGTHLVPEVRPRS